MKNIKKKRISAFALVIWNFILYGAIIILFLNLLFRKLEGKTESIEENVFLVAIPIFLIATLRAVIKNAKALYLCYKDEENVVKEEVILNEYKFLEMYKKVSRRRMSMVLIFPFIATVSIVFFSLLIASPNIPKEIIINIWGKMFSAVPITYIISFMILPLILFIKIYLSYTHNKNLLAQIYDAMSDKEIESLDNIGEKQCGYVFTKDFLINWDGFLNIIPLSKITKLEYISYFYLLVYGTRLRITADKKYRIWSYAPAKDEWIRRGFVSPSGKGDVNMNVQTPV